MKKIKKIFLPKWQRFVMVPLFVVIWILITYQEFFSEQAGEMGVVGYLMMTIIFLGVGLMMWFMTNGKLPAYIMEEEVKEESK